MVYLPGIVITFFLAIILLCKKGKSPADYVLACWLCVIGIHLFLYYWQITLEIYNHPYLLGLQVPMPLLQGPLLYIYTVTLSRSGSFRTKYWLHFIPAAIAYSILVNFYTLTAVEKISIYKHNGAGFEWFTKANLIAVIISGFIYVLLSFYELRKYRQRISEEFSNTERINLNWLRYLNYGILTIWMVILFNGDDPYIFGSVVIFVLLLAYFGIQYMGLFTHRRIIEKRSTGTGGEELRPATTASIAGDTPDIQPVTKKYQQVSTPAVFNDNEILEKNQMQGDPAFIAVKYQKSGLQKEIAAKIHSDLSILMQTEKYFKTEELTLAELAEHLNVHPNNLSQVINTFENKSFYDYINALRIEEFMALVLLPENNRYTLLSLAFECGFNSKSSFNRNFKKFTGQSPTTYLKDVNVQLLSS